jgi:NitT/TauT family transport system ATP-binding protein
MKVRDVNCGYLPLVDSAPLIIAQELKFAAEEGLRLNLIEQPSWSALRDMLALRHLDAAHMLSPMPVSMTLGLGGLPARIDALMVLSVNGTVIGASQSIANRMRAAGWADDFANPALAANALFAAADGPLRIGVPFPFSMHRLLLNHWLRSHPGFTDDSIQIISVPPPRMAEALQNNELDLFCVGEPWGSVAVQRGGATLVLPGSAIWQFAPEKVLGVRHDFTWTHAETCHALLRAVHHATRWLDKADNKPLAIEILTRSQHLNLPEQVIEPAITGRIVTASGRVPVETPNFLLFHKQAANFPWRSQAAWIAAQIAGLHGVAPGPAMDAARSSFRSDMYRTALGPIGVDLPGASEKLEGAMSHETAVSSTRGHMILGPDAFFDGQIFDSPPEKPLNS